MSETETALREEVARLRRDLECVIRAIGGKPGEDGQAPDLAKLSMEMHSLRAESVSAAMLDADSIGITGRDAKATAIEIDAEEGGGSIFFYDTTGVMRARLAVRDASVSLELINPDGKTALLLNAPGGHGQVAVSSPDGKGRAVMKSSALGGAVNVIQSNGHPGVYLVAEESGGKLEVISRGAHSAVSMFVTEGCGVVRVHEASGETMGFLSGSPDCGLLTVFGTLGEEAVTLCGTPEGGHVLLHDAHGELKQVIPPRKDAE